MTASEIVGGDEGLTSSPRNRVKFLCSYGGKILPRPSDGKLKYVGGETRMVAVQGEIKFSELMKKVNKMVEGNMVLKFLVIPDELDTLVTVKSDEDVKHMIDEYHRLESEGTSKLRAFLFPSKPIVAENQMNPVDHFAIEQRYIEAINGIVRPSSNSTSGRLTPVNPNRSNFGTSACSSPKEPSPDSFLPMEPPVPNGNQHYKPPMPKVLSYPNLYNPSNVIHPQSNNNNHSNHQVYQPHHYHQNHQQPQPYGIQSPRTPPDFRAEKPPAPHDFVRGAMGHGHVPVNRVYSIGRHNMANGYQGSPCCCDDCLAYASGGSSKRANPSTSGKLDKPDSPGHRSHLPE